MPYKDKTNKEYQKEYYLKNKQVIMEKINIYYTYICNEILYYQKQYQKDYCRNKINKSNNKIDLKIKIIILLK